MLELLTPRLKLTPLALGDTDELHELWKTPAVREHLWDGEVISRERTAEVVTTSARLLETGSFGLWGARFHQAHALIGFGGLWHFHDPPELELLYGIAAEHWGSGLATEIGRAVVDYAFGELGHRTARASIDPGNRASARVLEKLGFTLVRRSATDGRELGFYQLARAAEA